MQRYLFLLLLLTAPRMGSAVEVVGWVEKAHIFPGNMLVKARVDTGAKTSSLSADALRYFEREHETWVRFSTTNYKGSTIWLEQKVSRVAHIKQNDGGLKERPVIRLSICLAHIYQETEVTLENRDQMNYQLLIGRAFLNGHFLVNPKAVFTNPPRCSEGISKPPSVPPQLKAQ